MTPHSPDAISEAAPRPLENIRVLDLSRALAGPLCAQILGDLGAQVIKVERPGEGDIMRTVDAPVVRDADGAPVAGMTPEFISWNRNKRSVTLNLGSAQSRPLLDRLIASSDVLVENYVPGVLARYGLDAASLRAKHPALVYCTVSGYGIDGPMARQPGLDSVFQARSGWMSVTGEPDGDPQRLGLPGIDYVTGLYAAIAVLAAVKQRDDTGVGQHVDVSLNDCGFAAMAAHAAKYLATGIVPTRIGSRSPTATPLGLYRCADGAVNLTAWQDEQFRRFCAVMGTPDLAADARFSVLAARVANREALDVIIKGWCAARPVQTVVDALEAAGVMCTPINDIAAVCADPQINHRKMVVELPGNGVRAVGSPMRFSGSEVIYGPAPRLGQHNGEVFMGELGLTQADLAALEAAGAI